MIASIDNTAETGTFAFNEERHEYSSGGVVIPSVTQILSSLGYSNYEIVERLNPEALERKRQLGKLVHQAAHYHDENDLTERDASGQLLIPEVVYNRLAAYKKFRAETGYTPIINEGRGVGELYGMKYGMQFDSIGRCKENGPYWLVDLKNASGGPQRAWAIQTAAYAMGQRAIPKVVPSAFVRVIVQLFDDTSYKLFLSTDRNSKIFKPEDFQVWQAALAVAIDKRNHAIQ
jgi:hypothetical protein